MSLADELLADLEDDNDDDELDQLMKEKGAAASDEEGKQIDFKKIENSLKIFFIKQMKKMKRKCKLMKMMKFKRK
jgi:hypothetical protein